MFGREIGSPEKSHGIGQTPCSYKRYLVKPNDYVAAKATYIRLLHGKIGFLESFSALTPQKWVGLI